MPAVFVIDVFHIAGLMTVFCLVTRFAANCAVVVIFILDYIFGFIVVFVGGDYAAVVVIFPVVFIASVSISIIYFAYLIARSIVFIICINYIIIVGTFVYAATVFIILI